MADVVNPTELLKHSLGNTNYMKLFRLVCFGGTNIMRAVLNCDRLPGLPIKLANPKVKRRLESMRDEKIFTYSQWKELYRPRGPYGKCESFDITLMFILLREFSNLAKPRTGWDRLPDDKDLTLSADLVRIKFYRNKFSHNNGNMEVSDDEFKDLSNRIKNALVRMLHKCNSQKTAEWEKAIDDLLSSSKTEEDEVKLRQRIENGGTQLKKFLRRYYKTGERTLVLPFPSMEGERFHIENIYTRVKVSENDSDELIEMKSFFSPKSGGLTNCRRILIEGEPGIGKSSLCKKIAYDWSISKGPVFPNFPQLELVLVLKCRKLHHEDIWSLIEEEILPKELCGQKEEIRKYIKEQQEKLLLIIDGIDDIPAAHGPKTRKTILDDIQDIISGRMLSHCHLIVTSRTDKMPEIRKHFDNILNIRGFQWNDSCDFFRRFFSSSPDKARDIIPWIRKDNGLKELVGNPLYAAFTCLIFEEEQQERLDLYGFFHEIVFCVTKRYCVEKQDQQVSDDILMDKFRDEHLMLGELALAMIKGKIDYCFEEREFSSYSSQCLKNLGFLSHKKVMNRIRPKSYFYFSHSCIRKHFAAFYKRESSRIGYGGWMG